MNSLDLDQMHALSLRIAPELAAADLRLLRHQPEWPMPAGALAYAIRGRTLHIRDYLRSIGQWAGQWGSTIVFATEPTIGTLIHETAHLLPAALPIVDDDEPTEAQSGYQRGQFAAWADARTNSNSEPWRGHAAPFIRTACHLWFRAEAMGLDIHPRDLNIAGEGYGLSYVADYRRELELHTEHSRFTRKTFAEIAAEPMPPSFIRLFANDVARWHAEQLTEQTT